MLYRSDAERIDHQIVWGDRITPLDIDGIIAEARHETRVIGLVEKLQRIRAYFNSLPILSYEAESQLDPYKKQVIASLEAVLT